LILLDTNVISELMKPLPDARVRAWVMTQPRASLFTCTIVVAEVFSGLDLMPSGKRRAQLRERTEFMFAALFEGRLLNFDLAAAGNLGTILQSARQAGRPIDEMDALIAATAFTHNCAIATRNVTHFSGTGIELINPWD
jgi:toxin FitB